MSSGYQVSIVTVIFAIKQEPPVSEEWLFAVGGRTTTFHSDICVSQCISEVQKVVVKIKMSIHLRAWGPRRNSGHLHMQKVNGHGI